MRIPKFYAQATNFFSFETKFSDKGSLPKKHYIIIDRPLKYLYDLRDLIKKALPLLRKVYKKIRKINERFYKNITCQEIFWSTEFGFHDAALTAITAGCLWNLKNRLYINLRQNVQLKNNLPQIEIKPVFNMTCFNTNLKCIFKVRFGHIIIAGIRILFLLVSFYAKGGYQTD